MFNLIDSIKILHNEYYTMLSDIIIEVFHDYNEILLLSHDYEYGIIKNKNVLKPCKIHYISDSNFEIHKNFTYRDIYFVKGLSYELGCNIIKTNNIYSIIDTDIKHIICDVLGAMKFEYKIFGDNCIDIILDELHIKIKWAETSTLNFESLYNELENKIQTHVFSIREKIKQDIKYSNLVW